MSLPDLELPIGREDADPSVIVVGHDDVTVGVHGDARWPLQLPGGPASDPKPEFELPVVGEHLGKVSLVSRLPHCLTLTRFGELCAADRAECQQEGLAWMHWLLLSDTTTLPLLEAEMPCRLVNSPLSLPRLPARQSRKAQYTRVANTPRKSNDFQGTQL